LITNKTLLYNSKFRLFVSLFSLTLPLLHSTFASGLGASFPDGMAIIGAGNFCKIKTITVFVPLSPFLKF
jgi:hypothetical protein